MCQLKSCLVLKDRVYCPDYDRHQDMLDKMGIKDDYLGASKTFVRVELLPPDGVQSLMEPLDRWTINVDQDVTPEWWDERADRQRVEEAVEAWRRKHVFTEGEHSVEAGEVFAYDKATVEAFDSVTVIAFGNATVKSYDKATVEAFDSATVEACDSATVKAYGSATVKARNNATVTAYNIATVIACGKAMVIYPQKNKIVYPAGWTAETHD